MKISELAEFDGSKYLKDEETIRHYLAQAFEDGNPRLIQARSHGCARVTPSMAGCAALHWPARYAATGAGGIS
ncbi:hypothetical protein AQ932_06050 [Burkholderia pseudomallei]|nr:hypothetical protein AQ870_30010 [Burkholderia pseudomallei]OND30573.1 hypothetical protein AQ931_14235 [Burkholderia pseudomallei]OND34942.1 hypothetical protein AQ932_06050 [Burkholderia pseudomallei]OND43168.1 hypothetical protein AQ933_26655 [Burkholderia pseudomallei]